MTDAADVNSTDSWPDNADDVAEGYLANWFIREGSAVGTGETPCRIQVGKVGIDVTASTTGAVTRMVAAEGGDFTRGDVLARVQPSA